MGSTAPTQPTVLRRILDYKIDWDKFALHINDGQVDPLLQFLIGPSKGKARKRRIRELLYMIQTVKALRGADKSFEMLIERDEGKVPQNVQHGGQPDNPILVDVSGINDDDLINATKAALRGVPTEN